VSSRLGHLIYNYNVNEMGSCPQAEEAAMHLINLPTHLWVKIKDAEAILLDLIQTFHVS